MRCNNGGVGLGDAETVMNGVKVVEFCYSCADARITATEPLYC